MKNRQNTLECFYCIQNMLVSKLTTQHLLHSTLRVLKQIKDALKIKCFKIAIVVLLFVTGIHLLHYQS